MRLPRLDRLAAFGVTFGVTIRAVSTSAGRPDGRCNRNARQAVEVAGDTPSISTGNGKGKVRVLTRAELDGRTMAARKFDAIASGIAADLGGRDQLTTVQRALVEAFAGIAIMVDAANARLLLGEDINPMEHVQAVSTLVRVASRIGTVRVARDVTDPLQYGASYPSEPS